MNTRLITIFVRHSADCKYAGDEFCKRCNCRKHLRWTQDGKQYRRKAGTRSGQQAEEEKRRVEDQLAGRIPHLEPTTGKPLSEAVTVFIQSKKNKNITKKVLDKYTRELARLRTFCESKDVFTVQALTGELLTEYCGTWPELYPSTTTRAKVRERCRSFIRYCYQVRWLDRVLPLDSIQVDEPETMPLTDAEYTKLLDSVYVAFENKETQKRVHALITAHALVGPRNQGRAYAQAVRPDSRRREKRLSSGDLSAQDRHARISPGPGGRSQRAARRPERKRGLHFLVWEGRSRERNKELGEVLHRAPFRGGQDRMCRPHDEPSAPRYLRGGLAVKGRTA